MMYAFRFHRFSFLSLTLSYSLSLFLSFFYLSLPISLSSLLACSESIRPREECTWSARKASRRDSIPFPPFVISPAGPTSGGSGHERWTGPSRDIYHLLRSEQTFVQDTPPCKIYFKTHRVISDERRLRALCL